MKLNKVQTRTIKEFIYTYNSQKELEKHKEYMLLAQFTLEKEDLDNLTLVFSQTINNK